MKFPLLLSILILSFLLLPFFCLAQNPQNWTKDQLMEPSELAEAIKEKKDLPVIISIGPGAIIPHSIDNGVVNNKAGLEKLKAQLKKINPKNRVVIYCGCCPFEHCPNVRPAIDVLKEMKFSSYFLLNIPQNIKKDWIDMGYPVE